MKRRDEQDGRELDEEFDAATQDLVAWVRSRFRVLAAVLAVVVIAVGAQLAGLSCNSAKQERTGKENKQAVKRVQKQTTTVVKAAQGDPAAQRAIGVGHNGTNGFNGRDGRDGRDGRRGPQGDDGRRGPKGDTVPGAKGDPGATGDNGATGATGAEGAAGAACLATDPACRGPKGDDGAKGDPCLSTDPACRGPKGDDGADGAPGENGADGAPGAPPASMHFPNPAVPSTCSDPEGDGSYECPPDPAPDPIPTP